MNLFYKIEPEKTFAFVARALYPTRLRKDISKSFISLEKNATIHKYEYFWSIDLIKLPGASVYESNLCIRDAQGKFPMQEEVKTSEHREEMLEFLSLPHRLFNPTRVSCIVFNRVISDIAKVNDIIENWCQQDDKNFK